MPGQSEEREGGHRFNLSAVVNPVVVPAAVGNGGGCTEGVPSASSIGKLPTAGSAPSFPVRPSPLSRLEVIRNKYEGRGFSLEVIDCSWEAFVHQQQKATNPLGSVGLAGTWNWVPIPLMGL